MRSILSPFLPCAAPASVKADVSVIVLPFCLCF